MKTLKDRRALSSVSGGYYNKYFFNSYRPAYSYSYASNAHSIALQQHITQHTSSTQIQYQYNPRPNFSIGVSAGTGYAYGHRDYSGRLVVSGNF